MQMHCRRAGSSGLPNRLGVILLSTEPDLSGNRYKSIRREFRSISAIGPAEAGVKFLHLFDCLPHSDRETCPPQPDFKKLQTGEGNDAREDMAKDLHVGPSLCRRQPVSGKRVFHDRGDIVRDAGKEPGIVTVFFALPVMERNPAVSGNQKRHANLSQPVLSLFVLPLLTGSRPV